MESITEGHVGAALERGYGQASANWEWAVGKHLWRRKGGWEQSLGGKEGLKEGWCEEAGRG